MSTRFDVMMDWLGQILSAPVSDIAPASGDASFRRYFRVRYNGISRIVMDAPPEKENCRSFVVVANALEALGLHVPRILEANLEHGFLLLTDLGNRQYLEALNDASAEHLYGDALGALAHLQRNGDPATPLLPAYDAALLHQEMELFREWFLGYHLRLALQDAEHRILDDAFVILCGNALEQPKVWVHRDYHSRNLMVTEDANPGILDFQDAVVGPLTYDLVSLLRDCYIAWPRSRVEAWALSHRATLQTLGLQRLGSEATFLRWFDLMGVQRHLKAVGIFARLNGRDGKPGYLRDIPRTLGHILDTTARYPELNGLHGLLLGRLAKAGVIG